MGYYVNPLIEEKETFLIREGEVIDLPLEWSTIPEGKLPVILLNNVAFTAAGIGHNEAELNEFQKQGGRVIGAYLVDIEKLRTVSDLPDDIK